MPLTTAARRAPLALAVRVASWLVNTLAVLLLAFLRLAPPPPPSPPVVARPQVQARARALALARLARARAEPDPTARARALGELWVEARDAGVRAAALADLVALARPEWPADDRGDFLARIAPAVLEAARRHRVPPSVALGQAVLESGWGRSLLAARHHNLFGIKAGAHPAGVALPTREERGGRLVPALERYRVFRDDAECVDFHARLLARDRRYAAARACGWNGACFLERIARRYASDGRYVARVSAVVRRWRLDRWDAPVARAAERDDRAALRRARAPALADAAQP